MLLPALEILLLLLEEISSKSHGQVKQLIITHALHPFQLLEQALSETSLLLGHGGYRRDHPRTGTSRSGSPGGRSSIFGHRLNVCGSCLFILKVLRGEVKRFSQLYAFNGSLPSVLVPDSVAVGLDSAEKLAPFAARAVRGPGAGHGLRIANLVKVWEASSHLRTSEFLPRDGPLLSEVLPPKARR